MSAVAAKRFAKFDDFSAFMKSDAVSPTVLSRVATANPSLFRRLMRTPAAEGGLTSVQRSKIISAIDDVDPALARSLRSGDDVAVAGGKTATDQAFRAAKYAAAGVAGFTLIKYLDKKFDDEEEDYKNCMAACLPHNWDDYQYGNLEKSDLVYSTPDSIKEYQIEPIPNQPYCREGMECESYCGSKCKEESKADIPLLDVPGNLLGTAASGAGEAAGGLFGGLFGGLLEGLGLGGPAGGLTSALASVLSLVFFMIFMLRD
jgi:hypothetical protein